MGSILIRMAYCDKCHKTVRALVSVRWSLLVRTVELSFEAEVRVIERLI
jgi:hypothetical protein